MKTQIDHYDDKYFRDLYGRLLLDERYCNLLSSFWATVIFDPLKAFVPLADGNVLDYGCGLGSVTAALKNTSCFDISPFARSVLTERGRNVFNRENDIPRGTFDAVVCSHSLEHYTAPKNALEAFKQYVRRNGYLVLILPIETDFTPKMTPDTNQHLFCWTFQTISNLLIVSGWQPQFCRRIYSPFLLRTMGRLLPSRAAVILAHGLGRIKRAYPAILVLARAT